MDDNQALSLHRFNNSGNKMPLFLENATYYMGPSGTSRVQVENYPRLAYGKEVRGKDYSGITKEVEQIHMSGHGFAATIECRCYLPDT